MENELYDYSPIVEREAIHWPGDARVAFYVGLNVEHFYVDRPSTSLIEATASLVPDALNYGWRPATTSPSTRPDNRRAPHGDLTAVGRPWARRQRRPRRHDGLANGSTAAGSGRYDLAMIERQLSRTGTAPP